jgi:cyclophilin family peptidyl-prolyl cis-trans isomerase/HEAT repeat protein
MRRTTRRLTTSLLLGLLLSASAATERAASASPPDGEAVEVPLAWVEIATVEHRRGDPAALEPHLAPAADPETRRRAIVALGRIGARGRGVEIARTLLRRGGDDLPHVLRAVALLRDKTLLPDVLPHLDASDEGVVASAAEALGFLGDPRADGFFLPLLDHADERVRAAAALGLGRAKGERSLGRLSRLLGDPSLAVRRAAAAGAWLLARSRREARAPKEGPWEGDREGVGRLLPALDDADPEVRLHAFRAIASLLSTEPDDPGAADVALLAVSDPDARVVADGIARVIEPRRGARLLEALDEALDHDDPIVRERTAQAMATHATAEGASLASRRLETEADPRVRDALLVALARGGGAHARAAVAALAVPGPLHPDPVERVRARVRVLLASRLPRAVAAALAAADEEAPVLVRLDVLEALKDDEVAGIAGREAVASYAKHCLGHADPVVRSAAADLVGTRGIVGLAPLLVAEERRRSAERLDADARIEAVKALGRLATHADADPTLADSALGAIRRALLDPSPTVRLAAREAAAATKVEDLVEASAREDPKPNDWRGLPRPATPVLGIDFGAGDPFLSEEEVLRLAARIEAVRPRIAFETDAGRFDVEVDAREAPVHAANLVLLAHAKTYDGTRWHRVVPAFVVQGGDPRGDGSGDAGHSVPDEIGTLPFVRGALGMPKSTKDTGGCQVFVMHADYPPLDGNYTCYGRVVSGLETIDRLRVGDRIRSARVLAPSR